MPAEHGVIRNGHNAVPATIVTAVSDWLTLGMMLRPGYLKTYAYLP